MIHLNLIPDYHKERLKRERTFLLVHSIVGILVLLITASSVVLVVARQNLISHFNQVRKDTTLVNVKHQGISSDIEVINKKIANTAAAQQSFIKWTALLTDFTEVFPSGITLNFVHISRDSNAFRISGIADTRETLIATKEILEQQEFITTLDAPLSNFLERENIEFRFTGTINPLLYARPQLNTNTP